MNKVRITIEAELDDEGAYDVNVSASPNTDFFHTLGIIDFARNMLLTSKDSEKTLQN